jgi:hypothetical protein
MKSSFHSLIPFLQLFCQLPTPETQFSAATANSGTRHNSDSQLLTLNSGTGLSSLLVRVRVRVRVRVTRRLAVYRQWIRLRAKPLQIHGHHFFFQFNPCGHSLYVTPSLPRGLVCRLQLLLAFDSWAILGSESRGTHDHTLLSQIWDSPNLEGPAPYLYPPGTGWPSYTPRHWVSSPPRLAWQRWRYSNSPPHGISLLAAWNPRYIDSGLPPQKTPLLLLLREFASAGMCLPSRCLAMNYSGFQASCHGMGPFSFAVGVLIFMRAIFCCSTRLYILWLFPKPTIKGNTRTGIIRKWKSWVVHREVDCEVLHNPLKGTMQYNGGSQLGGVRSWEKNQIWMSNSDEIMLLALIIFSVSTRQKC